MASVTITWATDRVATSWVEYGPTTSYGSSTGLIDTTLVTAHSVTLVSLNAGTYHYRIHSRNAGGTEAITADASFSTAGAVTTQTLLMMVSA